MKYSLTRGVVRTPMKAVIYGPEGIGKTTLAAQMPGVVFIDAEGGSNQLPVARMPRPADWPMLLDEVAEVADHGKEAGISTVVIDTVDACERLCMAHVVHLNNKKSIEDFGYGKGYVLVRDEFVRLLGWLDQCVAHGINVVLVGHAILTKVELPEETSSYDKWGLKLIDTKRVSDAALVKEWGDAVLFLDYDIYVSRDDKTGKTAASGGRRVIRTTHGATFDAKNRFGLPDVMPLDGDSAAKIAALFADGEPLQPAINVATAPTTAEPDTPAKALMAMADRDGVTADEIQAFSEATGNYGADVDPQTYDPAYIEYMVDHWDRVCKWVEQRRAQQAQEIETPF